jgi:bifunctional non-homologous end joining protein LigD
MPHQSAKVPPYRPQLALLVKTPPDGDNWLHELKLDGFRIGVEIDHGKVRLLSRRDKEWTGEFPSVVAGAKRLPVKTALIDGELAGVLPDGRTSMHAMGGATTAFFAFDIIHLDGEDLTPLPLVERKERLRRALGPDPPPPFRWVDHVVGDGAAFFAAARVALQARRPQRHLAEDQVRAAAGVRDRWVRAVGAGRPRRSVARHL